MNRSNREQEARDALDRAARDSETVGSSSLARRAAGHFSGSDAELGPDGRPDPIELWGRRIGRGLAVVVAGLLIVGLGVQLGWWAAP
jgi:hypothetical protein